MRVSNIMSTDVQVIRPEASLQSAAEMMESLDVGALPVCDGTKLLGMLTDRDITIRAVAHGADPSTSSVSMAMSPDVIYCFDDDDVEEAAKLMEKRQIRRLPILNHDKKLVGILSLGDVATRTGDEKLSGEMLEEISEPIEQHRFHQQRWH
jgi:CBS domain-containing protein